MSRRKRLPPLAPGATRVFMVAVRCTDQDQHAEAGIADLGEFVNVDATVRVLWRQSGNPDPVTGWQAPDGSRTFLFSCRRCGRRNVVLREENVIAYLEQQRITTSKTRPVLDLSRLPPLLC